MVYLERRQCHVVKLAEDRICIVQYVCEAHQEYFMLPQVSSVEPPQKLPWQGPEWVIAVGCLTLKGGRTDWLVEKCTELGARSFLPLITTRSQAAGKNKFKVQSSPKASDTAAAASGGGGKDGEYSPGRLERLAVAANKQSLRVHALELRAPLPLPELLPMVRESPLSLVATAGAPPVLRAMTAAKTSPEKWYVGLGTKVLMQGLSH
jgi:16S rRNA (uracil1498-N3)-methyltransferase